MRNKLQILLFISLYWCAQVVAKDHQGITYNQLSPHRFTLVEKGSPLPIVMDDQEDVGVSKAASNLQKDFQRVTGQLPARMFKPEQKRLILIGTLSSKYIKQCIQRKKLDASLLKGKNEKYVMTTISQPLEGVDEALVIAGSDKRGAIYGIYELSEQLGVSPWYDWADVPMEKQSDLSIVRGTYSSGEPAVKYRGIFLNDEAPCLTEWVKATYGTNYGDHRFYERVFELILRLRGNFLWPAMWGWAFYADDPLNSQTAQDMGVIVGTSHHEPMARNHQEWARKRNEYGAWNYRINQPTIDTFFREGIERMKNTEDVVTIGMRGDGDEAMSEKADVELLTQVIKKQRDIISKVTRRPAKETPQVWALYKEVLDYYDKGMRVPDDVIMLLCDDNWGNVRRLPNVQERKHPGGFGMYYHVDYVGAPRNSKWMNVTPAQNMWEQLQLTYSYGVDKLWVLNVGDLKPMEYPITFFLDMAWNPKHYGAVNDILKHTEQFCAQQFGTDQAKEAARILNLYAKYNGRVTAEMLNSKTYNLDTGEWKQVSDEYLKLEAEALRQYIALQPAYKDAYKQLILFPVQAMANLYEMYYAQAMNHKLYAEGNPQANEWADKVEQTFKRDAELSHDYNYVMSGGKWKNMMIQKHIGYSSWNDDFPADKQPTVLRIEHPEQAVGGYVFSAHQGYVSMEAEHYYERIDGATTQWTVIPHLGRTLSGIALMPYTTPMEKATLSYRMQLPQGVDSVEVRVIVKSTLAFQNKKGHRYALGLTAEDEQIINFNANLNEQPQNIYDVFYPTVARRVVETKVKLKLPISSDGLYTLTIRPLDPGVVFEKIVVNCGGYIDSYLFMNESPNKRH